MPVATDAKSTTKESWRSRWRKEGRHNSQGHIRRYFLYREGKKERAWRSFSVREYAEACQKPEASNGEKPPAAKARTRSIMDARYILLPNNPGVLSMKIGYRWSFRTGMRSKISLKPRVMKVILPNSNQNILTWTCRIKLKKCNQVPSVTRMSKYSGVIPD